MFVAHKLKKGETWQSLCKAYKVKDPKILWQLPQNDKIRRLRKDPKALRDGDVVFMPNKTAKVYKFEYGGSTVVLTEAEWKKARKEIIQKLMNTVHKTAQTEYVTLSKRHDELNAIASGKLMALAVVVCQWFGGADEKVVEAARAKAQKAVNKLSKDISSGNFKQLQKSILDVEVTLKAFGKAVHKFRDQLINGAKEAYVYTEYTRDISFTIVAAAAATAAAPAVAGSASMLTGMKTMAIVGVKVGTGVGLVKGFAGEMGAKLVDKKRPWTTVFFNTLKSGIKGGVTGFFGGAAGGAVCKVFAGKLAEIVAKQDWLYKHASWYMRGNVTILSKGLQKLITPQNGAYVIDACSKTVAKFALRVGVASLTVWIRDLLIRNRKLLYQAFQNAISACKGNETIGELCDIMTRKMDFRKLAEPLMQKLINAAKRELEKTAVNIPIMVK